MNRPIPPRGPLQIPSNSDKNLAVRIQECEALMNTAEYMYEENSSPTQIKHLLDQLHQELIFMTSLHYRKPTKL